MSYSMFVGGELHLPPGPAHAAWLAERVDPSTRKRAPGLLAGGGATQHTVESLLKWLPKHIIVKSGSWLRPVQDRAAGTLTLTGVFVEDDVNDHAAALAEVFHLAAKAGGEGVLYFLEEQVAFHPQEPELCYVVRVTPKGSRAEHVPEDEQIDAIRGPLFAPVREELTERFADSPIFAARKKRAEKAKSAKPR